MPAAQDKNEQHASDIEQALVSVWRQTLVDGAESVEIGGEKYPIKITAKRHLKQVDFQFHDRDLRGLEQNPDTKSRWAKMAREGKKVMQFLDGGRYVAVVVDGKMRTYGQTLDRKPKAVPGSS